MLVLAILGAAILSLIMFSILWLGRPKPLVMLPPVVKLARALDAPPPGFDSWFAWEAVQFTEVPSAFWMDPYRLRYDPTSAEVREAQDRVARLFGLEVIHPVANLYNQRYRSTA